ncbi:site-2 protease family protein [Halobacillus salinus]|uniref:Stage IV sporulation protein FB n=1 Tax=Halobacillus salinus TaxID=192814 RepID=A0A4Z0H4Q1_9BACI|nr:site-2 protease family protein [Halobacillus salinus]TGB04175.1 stage IV sporulation protein FB [Halobacillus salinus]
MKALRFTNTIHIHPLFFLLAISALLTGQIYPFIVLFSIVVIHECGHFYMAKYYGWRVSKIEIWLFGGAVVSDEHQSRPIKEQVQVTLAGPLQHVWIFGLLFFLEWAVGPHPLLSTAVYYNGVILLFNLLPIWPLDGGKLVFYFFSQVATFRNTQLFTLAFSLCAFLSLSGWMTLYHHWTLASIWLAAFLLIEQFLEWRRRSYVLMRYLLYRSSNIKDNLPSKFIKVRDDLLVRDVLKNLRANCRHVYVLKRPEGSYIVDERECLDAFFTRGDANLRLRDIPNISQ